MADLSKFNINGVDYDLKDIIGRQGHSAYYLSIESEYSTDATEFLASKSYLSNDGNGVKIGDLLISSNGVLCKVTNVGESLVHFITIANIRGNENGSGGTVDLTNYLQKTELDDAINTALAQAKESGEFKGEPGYTPQKNVDYFDGDDYVLTDADKTEIAEIASKLVEVSDVMSTPEMFGAVGDGTTDDTEAIRSCINYANEHGLEVKFANGKKYKVNQKTPIVAHYSIDFNGAIIILSGGSTNPFIKLEPLKSNKYTLSANSLTEYAVNDKRLFNKCMTIVTPISLGVRNHDTGGNMPFTQTIKTDMNGNFINGKLECEIVDGSYTIRNVHDYMIQTLEIKNVTVDYSEIPDSDTAIFVNSSRSNVKFDNITIAGDIINDEWSYAVLGIYNSCNIEISNIRGNSPYSKDGSGYIVGLYEVTDVYMHDCDFGGSATQWGCLGISYISNFVAERVNTNRFDCHYYFTGYFTVRDCTTNLTNFCGGNGEMTYERVTFISLNNGITVLGRSDLNIMPSGTIKFSECTFEGGETAFKWSCPSPNVDLLTNIKYDFTHFIFENCKVHTSDYNLSYFDLSSGWDNVFVDIINAHTRWRTLYSYGESKVKRAIIRGCTFKQRTDISGCDEVIIKECCGDTVYVADTNNSCILCDNIFTPTNTTLIKANTAIIANNIILADKSLDNKASKYVVANNLPLYDTYKSKWANASK